MLNRFFGQKQQQQQQEPENEPIVAPERAGGDSTSEQGLNPLKNSLSRTRKLFGRLGDSFRQNDITDDLWDELEEALISADVGPSTSMWLIERLRQRATELLYTFCRTCQALAVTTARLFVWNSNTCASHSRPMNSSILRDQAS